jgi:hypothetical protein
MKLDRREFIAYALAMMAGCAKNPAVEDPKFENPVSIEFYGLSHFEAPEEREKTLEKITNVLNEKLEENPYDLLSIEVPFPIEDLPSVARALEEMLCTFRQIGDEHQDSLPGGLKHTIALHEAESSGIKHAYHVYRWAKEKDTSVINIDIRRDWRKAPNGEIVSGARMYELSSSIWLTKDLAELKQREALYGNQLERYRKTSPYILQDLAVAYETGHISAQLWKAFQGSGKLLDDTGMARELIRQIEENKSKHVGHFGGAFHFLPMSNSIYSIMKKYSNCSCSLLTNSIGEKQ